MLLHARWLLQTGRSPLPDVAAYAAMPKVSPGPQAGGKLAGNALTQASMLRIAADWQSSHGLPAAATIAQGLAALADSERLAGGVSTHRQAERGALLAVNARIQKEPSAKKQAAEEAAALLRPALHDRPPLTWLYRSYLEAAEQYLKTAQ